jgi:hypothetical protein
LFWATADRETIILGDFWRTRELIKKIFQAAADSRDLD